MIVISLAIALLTHFGLIVYYGEVVIREPRPVVLSLEIAGLIGSIVFASLNLAK